MQTSVLNKEQILRDSNYEQTLKCRVRHFATKWSYRGVPLPQDELHSEALVILAECLDTYDPSRARFDTFLWSELGKLKHVAWKEQRRLHRYGTELNEAVTAELAQPQEQESLGMAILSEDARTVLEWLLVRGIQRGKAPGPMSAAYWMKWSRDRMDDAWEELNCWWHNGGLPTESVPSVYNT